MPSYYESLQYPESQDNIEPSHADQFGRTAQIGQYPHTPPPVTYIPPELQLNRIATPAMAQTAFETGLTKDIRILLNIDPAASQVANPALLKERIVQDLGERIVLTGASTIDAGRSISSYAIGTAIGAAAGGPVGAGLGFIGGIAIDEGTRLVSEITGLGKLSEFFDERSFIQGISKEFVAGVNSDDLSGRGFTSRQSGDIARFLKEFYKETGKGFEEINQEMVDIFNNGLITNVTSVDDFKRQFKSLKDSVKEIVKTFKTTEEEAIETISMFQQRGIGSSDVLKLTEMAKRAALLTGRDPMQVMQSGFGMAEAFQGTGMTPVAGYNLGITNDLGIRGAIASGRISDTAIWNMGGADRAQQIISQMSVQAFNDPRGDALLRAAMQKDGTVDMGIVLDTISGDRNVFQNANSAVNNMLQGNNYLRYPGVKESMVSGILEEYPGLGSAMVMRGILEDARLAGVNVSDYQELTGFARLAKGIDPATFEVLSQSIMQLNDTLTQSGTETETERRNAIEAFRLQQSDDVYKTLDKFGLGSMSGILLNASTLGGYGLAKGAYKEYLERPLGKMTGNIYDSVTIGAENIAENISDSINRMRYGSTRYETSDAVFDLLRQGGLEMISQTPPGQAFDASGFSLDFYDTPVDMLHQDLKRGVIELESDAAKIRDRDFSAVRIEDFIKQQDNPEEFYTSITIPGEGRILDKTVKMLDKEKLARALGSNFVFDNGYAFNIKAANNRRQTENLVRRSVFDMKEADIIRLSDAAITQNINKGFRNQLTRHDLNMDDLLEKSAQEQFDFYLEMPELKEMLTGADENQRRRIGASILGFHRTRTGTDIPTDRLMEERGGAVTFNEYQRRLEDMEDSRDDFIDSIGSAVLGKRQFGLVGLFQRAFGFDGLSSKSEKAISDGYTEFIVGLGELKDIAQADDLQLRALAKSTLGLSDKELAGESIENLRHKTRLSVSSRILKTMAGKGADRQEISRLLENAEKLTTGTIGASFDKTRQIVQDVERQELFDQSKSAYEAYVREKIGDNAANEFSAIDRDMPMLQFLHDRRRELFPDIYKDSVAGEKDDFNRFIQGLKGISKTGTGFISEAGYKTQIKTQDVAGQQVVAALSNIVALLEALMQANGMKTLSAGSF